MIRQVIYTSTPTDNSDSQMPEILRCARRNNPELGLTGLLVEARGRFVQLLEGDDEFVAPMLDILSTDRRHSDIRYLMDRETDRRAFPDWSMAGADLDPASAAAKRFETLLESCADSGTPEDGDTLVAAMIAIGTPDDPLGLTG